MDFNPLIKARKTLDTFWKNACLKGRCWGSKREDDVPNPFRFSNIVLADEDHLVSISQGRNGELVIHQFKRVKNTLLGDRVKSLLMTEGIKFRNF